jgi:tetratricopeptide (TPR) repeat protein
MKKAIYDKASSRYIFTTFFGIMMLVFLILVSIAGTAQSTNVWFHIGSELMSSEKYNESIKAYEKAIEINPQDSDAWTIKEML